MTAAGLSIPSQAGGDLGGVALKTPCRGMGGNEGTAPCERVNESRRQAPLTAGAGVSPVQPNGGPGCGKPPEILDRCERGDVIECATPICGNMAPEAPTGTPTRRASGAGGGEVGGAPSNTPPQNSKREENAGGEDWLEWSACVDWGDGWADLRPRLQRAKEAAQDTTFAKETGADMQTFGDWTFSVAPEGARAGLYFAFRLTGPGVVLLVQDRNKPTGDKPNVLVRSDGSACLQWGGFGCLELGRTALGAMGATIGREKLSRVDMALDLPGVGMDEFAAAFNEKRYITQAKGRGFHESTGVTVYLGKCPLMLRIYDKAAEMKTSGDPLKTYLMLDRRWQGKIPEKAIRVEFQLSREALKDRGIDTPMDYFAKRADMAAYLCREWVRFTASDVDRTNTTRMPVLPLWLAVADGFRSWTGEPAGLPLTPLDRGKVDVGQLEKQAVGVLLTAAVLSGKASDIETFCRYCSQVVGTRMPEARFQQETLRRSTR